MALTMDRSDRRVIHRRPNAVANVTRMTLLAVRGTEDESCMLVVLVVVAAKLVVVAKDENETFEITVSATTSTMGNCAELVDPFLSFF